MDFEDIGFFGLPLNGSVTPSAQSAAAASSRSGKRKAKRTKNDNVVGAKKAAVRRPPKSQEMVQGKKKRRLPPKNEESESSSDDDDDQELSLAQLAHTSQRQRPNTKPPSAAVATATAVTPGPFLSSNRSSAAASSQTKKNTKANKNQQGSKKLRKQLGLHSFLTKATKKSLPSDMANDSSDTSNTMESATASSISSSNNSSSNKKRPHSFVSAASLMNNSENDQHSNEQTHDMQQQIHQPVHHTERVQDELEEFSDDGCDNIIEKEMTKLDSELGDEREGSADDSKNDIFAVKESKEERLFRIRKKNNPIEYGIHKSIMGHRLPTMHPHEHRAIDTSFVGSNDNNPSDQHESRLLQGKSGVNILSHLFQRSCLSSTPRIASNMEQFAHSGNHWNISDTVELTTAGEGVAPSNGEICSMSFDQDGVLLATGDDRGYIRVYDFDDVYSLDLKKRNEVSRILLKADEPVNEADEAEATAMGDVSSDSNSNEGGDVSTEAGNDDVDGLELPTVPPPSVARPVLSFQCRTRPGGNVGPRISSVLWSPQNQDHLLVAFANHQEVHIYDIASSETPPPCLRLGDSRHSRSEGVLKAIFLPSSKSSSTYVLTGGNYGTARLWTIPKPQSRQQVPSISSFNAKCTWSIPVFGSKGEGVCDLMALPTDLSVKKPLVFLAGNGSSLALFDTNKVTRKSFSASVTPTLAASWDLYALALRELTKIDSEAKLPARRWMAAHRLSVLGHECASGVSWFKIGMVVKCGWVFMAELTVPSSGPTNTNQTQNNSIRLRLHIVHHTPRMQCFNSLNERLATAGGMALQFSLPHIPTPSSDCSKALQNMIWLGDVKAMRYNMPPKDKYVLCKEHGTITSQTLQSSSDRTSSSENLRHPGEGLILANFDSFFEAIVGKQGDGGADQENKNVTVCARLPLSHGSPLSLAAHPSGEWMVVGYGMNGRGTATKPLELVCMRKRLA